MRISVACLLLFSLLGWLASWFKANQMVSSGIINALEVTTGVFAGIGIIGLGVFLAGFLITMLRDLRPENRHHLFISPIDKVQNLVLQGQMGEAAKLYQKQYGGGLQLAQDVVAQIDVALKSGLRV